MRNIMMLAFLLVMSVLPTAGGEKESDRKLFTLAAEVAKALGGK